MGLIELKGKKYNVVGGTYYDLETNDEVVNVLERCRMNNTRVVLDYGDTTTGKSWNERYDVTGRIGRSSGRIKVPLLIHNKRSTGGGMVLTRCIIGIKESKGSKALYRFKGEEN